MMKASIAEAKARLSFLIAHVKSGEEVVLTDRGRPVARLTSIETTLDDATLEMVKLGLIRLPAAPARMPVARASSDSPVEVEREDRF